MSEDSTTQCLLFPGIFRKPIVAQFDQREGSSDGGALLLKAAAGRYGDARRVARRRRLVGRTRPDLVTQRRTEPWDLLAAGRLNLLHRFPQRVRTTALRPRPGDDHRAPKMTISNLSEAERNPAQIGIR